MVWCRFLLNAIPTLVSVLTFTAYIVLGNELTAAKAFTSLSLFTVLRMPLFQLPQVFLVSPRTVPWPHPSELRWSCWRLSMQGQCLGSAVQDENLFHVFPHVLKVTQKDPDECL